MPEVSEADLRRWSARLRAYAMAGWRGDAELSAMAHEMTALCRPAPEICRCGHAMDGIRVTDGVVYICPDCGYETVRYFQKPA